MNTATAHPFERACWAGAALLAIALLQSVVRVPLGVAPVALTAGVVLFAAVAPWPALLLIAAAGPLSSVLFHLAGPTYEVRFEEIVVLAYLAGAAMHQAARPGQGGLPLIFRWSSWLLLFAAFASGLVVLSGMAAADPAIPAWQFAWRMVSFEYLQGAHALFPAMLLVEGVLLALISAELCARHPLLRTTALTAAMVASAAAAGLLTIVRLLSVAWAREDPWAAIGTLIAQFRISVVHPDLNAAGSYFAMMLCVTLAFARHRTLTLVTVPVIGLALWTSGSRAALLALALMALITMLRSSALRVKRPLLLSAVATLVLLAGLIGFYPHARNENVRAAALFRMQLARAAAYAVTEAPVFGIGAGRFYDESMRYIAATRPSDTPLHVGGNENAHNNFLQIAAELGVIGLVLFLVVVAAALKQPQEPAVDPRLQWPLAAALGTYLLTCVMGHPLLVASAAYPFWLLLGVSAAAQGITAIRPAGLRLVAAAVALTLLVALPFRIVEASRNANLEHVGVGVSRWQRDSEGARFRWAGGHSSIYVPGDASAVRIPVRHGGVEPPVIEVRIFVAGREANRVLVESGGGWMTVRLRITPRSAARFIKVDLLATSPQSGQTLDIEPTHESGALMIGRIEPEGSR